MRPGAAGAVGVGPGAGLVEWQTPVNEPCPAFAVEQLPSIVDWLDAHGCTPHVVADPVPSARLQTRPRRILYGLHERHESLCFLDESWAREYLEEVVAIKACGTVGEALHLRGRLHTRRSGDPRQHHEPCPGWRRRRHVHTARPGVVTLR